METCEIGLLLSIAAIAILFGNIWNSGTVAPEHCVAATAAYRLT